jgi:hypothetical protein
MAALPDFTLHIKEHSNENYTKQLTLNIEEGITEIGELRKIYNAFCKVRIAVEGSITETSMDI